MSVDELKAQGNAAFQAGKNVEAVNWFSQAIKVDPSNHVLYSNRSAAHCAEQNYPKALEDAIKTTEVKSDWPKGWMRKGQALQGQKKWKEALTAYQKGLELDPNMEACKRGVSECQAAVGPTGGMPGMGGMGGMPGMGGANPFAQMFQSPDLWAKLAMNPKLQPLLQDEGYVNKIKMIQANPEMMQMFMQDKQIMNTVLTLAGISMDGAGGDDDDEDGHRSSPEPTRKQPQKPKELTPEEKERKDRVDRAAVEKDKGNAHYKKKEFEQALECYDNAYSIEPENILYLTNKAAVYTEMEQYDKAIEVCDDAITKGKEQKADFQHIAKALARKATAYHKKGDYDTAIKLYSESLTEHRTADTLTKLRKLEKEKEETAKLAYLDDDKAQEAKTRGNEHFKNQNYPAALKEYEEAVKRNPKDHTFYSNRSACYMKLGEYGMALKEVDKCLDIDPKFVKGITRKAHIYYWTKEYHKALQWYELGLQEDPNNEELRNGVERTVAKIEEAQQSGQVDEDRVRKAMSDPEIQSILQDPVMQSVLKDCGENPSAANKHLQNPGVAAKIKKLMAAGILNVSRGSAPHSQEE